MLDKTIQSGKVNLVRPDSILYSNKSTFIIVFCPKLNLESAYRIACVHAHAAVIHVLVPVYTTTLVIFSSTAPVIFNSQLF